MAEATEGTFTCDQCKRSFVWKPQLAGKRVACKCGQRINVPLKPTPRKPTATKSVPRASDAPKSAAHKSASPKTAVAADPLKRPKSAPAPTKSKTAPAKPLATPSSPRSWNALQSAADPSAIHTAITPGFRSAGYQTRGRGLLIGVGILSILVGLICALANFVSAGKWNQNYLGSVPRSVVNAAEGPALPPPTFSPYTGTTMRPTGLSPAECLQIAAATPFDGPAGAQRRDMLEHLLGEAGRLIMPNLASDTLRPAISPTTSPDTPDRPASFLAPHGTVTVHQNWAKYESESQPAVVVDKNIATIDGTTYLSAPRINQNLRQLREKLPKITNMQLEYVADYLIRLPYNPTFGDAAPDFNAQNVYSSAALGGVKILAIRIQGVDLLVLPNGRGTLKSLAPAGLDIVTNCPMFAPIKDFQPLLPGDPDFMFWLSICCLAAMVLAVYLVLAGIITLISPARWARLHMVYAIVGVLLIVTEGGLSMSLYTSITAANAKAVHSSDNTLEAQRLIAISAAQIIYPLALVGLYMRNPRLGRRGM